MLLEDVSWVQKIYCAGPPMAMRWLLVVTKAGRSQQSPIIYKEVNAVKEPHGLC
jgi:hypothetical protein